MQIGFYFDQTRCTGCGACQVACKDWNDLPAGSRNWMRVLYTEMGKFPNVFVGYLIAPCYHCQHPPCAHACPVAAIEKRDVDGIVIVDSHKCLGNIDCPVKCLKACPYGAPQFGEEKGAKMNKCDYCLDRWVANKLPACVEACPTRALDAGSMETLADRYGRGLEAVGFDYKNHTKPAVVLKSKPVKFKVGPSGPRQ